MNLEKHRKNCNVRFQSLLLKQCVHFAYIWRMPIYFESFSICGPHFPVVSDLQFQWLLGESLHIQPVSWNYSLAFHKISRTTCIFWHRIYFLDILRSYSLYSYLWWWTFNCLGVLKGITWFTVYSQHSWFLHAWNNFTTIFCNV